ncbi:MAG: hypothetical protein IJW22_00560, partial [Clostridia bacterium]|nr:hypothetical protein [Clostridia bacterium]
MRKRKFVKAGGFFSKQRAFCDEKFLHARGRAHLTFRLFCGIIVVEKATGGTMKLLFIGNSHTYYNA